METATGKVTVESINPAQRVLLLRREDGARATFKAGPEVRRFNQIKVGDEIMTTLTENCTIFVIKGKMQPGVASQTAIVRTPEGQSLGGLMVSAVNVDAKVLDVDHAARRVILQYSPTQAKGVDVRPSVNLDDVAVGDTVLVRGTRSLSILVADP